MLFVVAAKWILIGRFRPGEHPLWSMFVWRNELVTAMHENVADPFLIEALKGTPYIAWFFRMLGAKIGPRAFICTTCFTEYDLAEIGHDAALNPDCTIQTHLFEDRVMKAATVRIGPHCSVGAGSVVLYDSVLNPGAVLSDLSLVMKGETLPAASRWEGVPCRRSPMREHSPLAEEPRKPRRIPRRRRHPRNLALVPTRGQFAALSATSPQARRKAQ